MQPADDVHGEAELSDAEDSDELFSELLQEQLGLEELRVDTLECTNEDSLRDVSTIVLHELVLLLEWLDDDAVHTSELLEQLALCVLPEHSEAELFVDQLDALEAVELECWLVEELVDQLQSDSLLIDCVDGLLSELELVELDETELLLLATVLELDELFVDDELDDCVEGVLHELCEHMLVLDVLHETVLDELLLAVLDELALLSVQPADDRLHEAEEQEEDDALEQLALEAVQPPELSEQEVELLVLDDDAELAELQLKLDDEWLLSVELVEGVDQLLDSLERTLEELQLEADEPDD